MPRKPAKGFTLVELMIALSVLVILTAIAYPSYTKYIQKGRRAEARSQMLDVKLGQERWRVNNVSYATSLSSLSLVENPANSQYYNFSLSSVGAVSFKVTAAAKTGTTQTDDESKGTSCATLTLNHANYKTPTDCW